MEFKLNIGEPKSGKTFQKQISEAESNNLTGRKIGDKIKGDNLGFKGYEFEITGGSDSSGFPMRFDVSGSQRKKILIASGVGTRHNRKGIRLRRTVAGNTIFSKTAQINLKVIKYGKGPLVDKSAEEKPADEAKTDVKEESAPEAEAKSDEKPKEETKEEVKKEEKKEEKAPAEEKSSEETKE